MRAALLVPALLALVPASALAQAHHCAADAIARAKPLLLLHHGEQADAVAIEDNVKALPSIKALKGNGRFDVLEVWGHIYKADYRMRFIYARIKDDCALMGQEILEASDPY